MRREINLTTGQITEHDDLPGTIVDVSKDEQIAMIEALVTGRWLRMAHLGDAYAIGKLQEIEDQIEVIRNS
tara:strand:- start:613 stop:825 length:213 start_codon:yes stop_codon:yes gene_type:complete